MSELKTLDDMRSFLADELMRVRSNDTTPAAANAAANLAGKILGSVKLELEYNKMAGTTPHINFIGAHKKIDELKPRIEDKQKSSE